MQQLIALPGGNVSTGHFRDVEAVDYIRRYLAEVIALQANTLDENRLGSVAW
ncbi:hypothetical protein [Bradyrhizobium brasilense]|uniref:hypothetical protein n=1 Tax=Bradyrhizobium brasilense TaxID=1419277 RepID=UPI001E4307AF|nr:hypothetical protein [Bradyrhizobium brasilense]MCC8969184.1 hypothetical protein [Bradyrhizobium brasilense]